MKKIIDNLKYIKLYDIAAVLIFIVCFPISLCFKLVNKILKRKLWLICDRENTASDNGYHFFKYIRENHPNDYAFYAIDKRSKEYGKVAKYGNVIQWKSFKHWIFYLSADYNISSQKNGNPSAPFFYVLHVKLNLLNNRVFLQHGITMNDAKFLYYNETKFKKFICGAGEEYEYIKTQFGYPSENLLYTGFSRFDNLHDITPDKTKILVMPTWRNWLGRETNSLAKREDFCDTNYFKNWNALLKDKRLNEYINSKGITLYFYPHFNMQKFINSFELDSENIKVVDINNSDIQELLKNTSLMVTDYSSVHMDFAYMKKPIVYYQFDKEEFREKQYAEGYFKYDTFGCVLETCDEVVNKMIDYIEKNYQVEENYKHNMDNFFELYDANNCERIYNCLK